MLFINLLVCWLLTCSSVTRRFSLSLSAITGVLPLAIPFPFKYNLYCILWKIDFSLWSPLASMTLVHITIEGNKVTNSMGIVILLNCVILPFHVCVLYLNWYFIHAFCNSCRLRGKSQIIQDELIKLREQMVHSAEGTKALALELCREFEDKFLQHITTGELRFRELFYSLIKEFFKICN